MAGRRAFCWLATRGDSSNAKGSMIDQQLSETPGTSAGNYELFPPRRSLGDKASTTRSGSAPSEINFVVLFRSRLFNAVNKGENRTLTALLLTEFALGVAAFSQPRLLRRYFTTPYSLEGSIEAF